MFIGISNVISGIRTAGLSYIKDNLKLYLDFKSSRSDTLAFPSEGSTSFDGTNDEIKIADSSELQLSTLTISAWVKPNGASEDGYIFTKFDDSTSGGYALGILGSTNKIRLLSSGVSISQSDAVFVDDNVWVHVAVTVDGSGNLVYYRNGVSAGTASSVTLNTNSVGAVIGNRTGGSNTGHYFNGKMANVAIWSRVLSPEEVQSVMNKSYSQLGSVEKTSLVSWWALDTNNGVVANNSNLEETLGSNVLSNGDFASGDLTSWNAVSGGSAMSAVNNSLVHAVGTSGGVRQSVTLTSGVLYKGSFDILEITSGNNGNTTIQITIYNYAGSSIKVTLTQYSVGTNTFYFVPDDNGIWFEWGTGNGFTIDNFTLKKVTSLDGAITGATTTTSVYGGNAPILPRAIDIAESQAEAIGNGSALFDGTDDYIQVDNITLPNLEPYTITAWIKTTDVDQTQAIVLWGDQASYERRALILYNGGGGSDWTLVASTNGDNAQGATNVTEGEWTHASITVTPSTKAYKIYMNGILDGSGTFSNTLVAFSNSTLFIGKSYYGEFFEGNIAGVGIWYGELTQAQIQSVMESTSYAKIPADVKSTLGSELLADGDMEATGVTSWDEHDAGFDVPPDDLSKDTLIKNSGSQSLKIDMQTYPNSGVMAKITSLDTSKVYKFTGYVRADSSVVSANGVELAIDYDGDFAGDRDDSIATYKTSNSNITADTWTSFTYYFVPTSATAYFGVWVRSSGIVHLDDWSVKEVTNDLVAYYPLDADSSRGNGTDNVVTGETLGSELFSGWTNNGDGSSYGAWDTFNYDASTDTATASGTDANDTFRATFTSEANAIYKISYNIIAIDSSVQQRGVSSATHLDSTVPTPTLFKTNISTGLNTFYVIESASGGTRYVGFRAGTGGKSITVSNYSIKEVTSNTGVLK